MSENRLMSEKTPPVRIERTERVACIVIDNPPINAGSAAVRAGLLKALSEVTADPSVDAAVIIGAGKTFIAGSDLREFAAPLSEPQLPAVIAAIEACPKPVVAAIHGAALGGGFEVALGCDGRIAGQDAVVGLPEGTFGIIPGAGGTVRLPRLVDAARALDIIVSCRRVKAPEAYALGLIDLLSAGDLRADAISLAGKLVAKRRLRDLPPITVSHADLARAELLSLQRGRSRAHVVEAVAAIRRALSESVDAALGKERAVFERLRRSEESRPCERSSSPNVRRRGWMASTRLTRRTSEGSASSVAARWGVELRLRSCWRASRSN